MHSPLIQLLVHMLATQLCGRPHKCEGYNVHASVCGTLMKLLTLLLHLGIHVLQHLLWQLPGYDLSAGGHHV